MGLRLCHYGSNFNILSVGARDFEIALLPPLAAPLCKATHVVHYTSLAATQSCLLLMMMMMMMLV